MKKTNTIIAAVLAVISVVLLVVWYALGLNHVDEPLDLVLSVVWWVVIVGGAVLLVRLERVRRARVRTVYVADGRIYNSEAGTVTLPAGADVTGAVSAVLGALTYDFANVGEGSDASKRGGYKYVVRSLEYGDSAWEGEVAVVATGNVVPFSSRDELARIIG